MARQKIIPPPIVNIAMAVMSAASNSSSPSALELASRTHKHIFFGYMCWLAIAAIATLFFTWALWKSSNRRQDAAKREADLRVLNVEQTVADSKKAAAEAIARAAEANRIAEEERLARVKLEARLAFRSIDPKTKAEMSKSLKHFAPQAFEITTYPEDQECISFANELALTLMDAGWELIPSEGFLGWSLVTAITVEFGETRKEDFGVAAQALAAELTKAGFPSKPEARGPNDTEVTQRIRIRLGKKP